MTIEKLGWNKYIETNPQMEIDSENVYFRVTNIQRKIFTIDNGHSTFQATISGSMYHKAKSNKDLPAIGDWVKAITIENENKAVIKKILPRKSRFIRKQPISGGRKLIGNNITGGGTTDFQILASNIDILFIILDAENVNIQRLERYILMAGESNVEPFVVLNKIDLIDDCSELIEQISTVMDSDRILLISATEKTNIEAIKSKLKEGITSVFVGSSGVGKSTLLNSILGEEKQLVRSKSQSNKKGVHTTTDRSIHYIPGGGLIIDTPGIKELALWCGQNSVDSMFDDITELIDSCKFSDCAHVTEPGCAIKKALKSGDLDSKRWENYLKITGEIDYLDYRQKELLHLQQQRIIFKDAY